MEPNKRREFIELYEQEKHFEHHHQDLYRHLLHYLGMPNKERLFVDYPKFDRPFGYGNDEGQQ